MSFRRISSVLSLTLKLNGLSIRNLTNVRSQDIVQNIFRSLPCSGFHSSSYQFGLMEFFDDEKNWGSQEVRVGRSWKKDELRIKSNEDLHKLWFVLLKEKNMLLTMEYACKEENELFPNPERIDKVEESMKNLESVVKERNSAYTLLETGEEPGRPGGYETDPFGQRKYMKYAEHTVPKWMNRYKLEEGKMKHGMAVFKFKKLMKEKSHMEKKRIYNRTRNHIYGLIKRFPNMDIEALEEQYPNHDVRRMMAHKKARSVQRHQEEN
ncbi:mitochondrial ribosomal protein L47 isoform X2 [Oratosquilla oratoria]|uniref:mitochondrial ribosomal protein L47 isoform X2 n=1 Tax=Oratosquilla oratoria TaxID=337810 RepID=UPI003F76C37B